MMPHFKAEGIVKAFTVNGETRAVLPGDSLALRQGEILALLGPSGCGKSTFLNILAGFTRADAGRVVLDGVACGSPGPDRAVVFQEDALFPWLTAEENITIGLKAMGIPRLKRREETAKMLQLVGLADFAGHLPKALSGGMRQRLALARVLALGPKILLMDEPFAALDAITREQMHELLIALHQSLEMTILFVTHDIREAVHLADTIVVMGKVGQGFIETFNVPDPRRGTGVVRLELAEKIRESLRG